MGWILDIAEILTKLTKGLWARKESREEEEFLESFRKIRLQNKGNVLVADLGSEKYRLCERLVSKGKLCRNGVAAYILPEDAE